MIYSYFIFLTLVAGLSSNIQSASSLILNTLLIRLSIIAIIFSSFLIMNYFYILNTELIITSLLNEFNLNIINFDDNLLLLLNNIIITKLFTKENQKVEIPLINPNSSNGFNNKIQDSFYSSNTPLNPWAVTGFIDAEGSFGVKISPNSSSKIGWNITLTFSILLNIKDLNLLYNIQNYFNVGNVYNNNNTASFYVSSLKDLKVIVEHFINYPLVTAKSSDFKLWLNVYNLMIDKAHLTLEGLYQIVSIKANLNLGLSNKLQAAFPNLISTDRPVFIFQSIPNNNWLSGFVSGDGSFSITITKGSTLLGERVQLGFIIDLHKRDLDVLKGISNLLFNSTDAKYVYSRNTRNAAMFSIKSFTTIIETIIPFFNKYPLIGCKEYDFNLFKQAAKIISKKEHLTLAGFNNIITIRKLMNKYE